jgi:hypothetical protein
MEFGLTEACKPATPNLSHLKYNCVSYKKGEMMLLSNQDYFAFNKVKQFLKHKWMKSIVKFVRFVKCRLKQKNLFKIISNFHLFSFS